MCGRYAASARPDELIEAFDVEQDHTGEPSRSVLKNPHTRPRRARLEHGALQAGARRPDAPATERGRERRPGGEAHPLRQLRLLTWGLVPAWSKDVTIGLRMTNARAESVLGKGAFAKAALSRRCIVPADGWYQWQVSSDRPRLQGQAAQAALLHPPRRRRPVAFAGLYEFWRDRGLPDGDPAAWLTTFTIITTAADPGMDRIHDRQPLVLEPDQWEHWLDPAREGPRLRPGRPRLRRARALRGAPRRAAPSARRATTARPSSSPSPSPSSRASSTR